MRSLLVSAVVVLAAVAALTAGCGHATPAPGQALPPATPTMTPTAVPGLGPLALGTFPATWGGAKALRLCEDWAGLRGAYAARVQAGDTAFQLEQWFSAGAWQDAFAASGPLQVNPGYNQIAAAFGMATIGQTAGIAQARRLDAACRAAD